jgi:SPP1 gp7 family putative phage head morphogenesis protein
MSAAAESAAWVSLPFDEAIAYLREMVPMTDEQYAALEDWARRKAFTSAGVVKVDLLQSMLDALVFAVAEGGTLADFSAELDDLFAAAGLDPLNPWRTETIFRTNVLGAYGAGHWEQGTDPAIAGDMYGWRFDAVMDDRTDEPCADLDGHVFAGSDGANYFPPIHFNCRCTADWITNAEAADAGISPSGLPPQSVVDHVNESVFVSPAVGDAYTPDFTNVDPALIAAYVSEQQRRGL